MVKACFNRILQKTPCNTLQAQNFGRPRNNLRAIVGVLSKEKI